MTDECQFYLTTKAIESFAELEGIPHDSDDDFDAAEDRLADRASRASKVRDQDNGLQLWRLKQDAAQYGCKQQRYRLLVAPPEHDDPRPRVTRVMPETSMGLRRR